MKRSLQNLLAELLCALGLPALWRWLNRRKLVVVVYHGVVAEPPAEDTPDWHLVPIRHFTRQIDWLRRHYDIVDLDSGLARLERNALDRPTACITFDDGYRNNRTVALPILAQHNAPATIFLVTGMIGTDRLLWTVALETAFRRSTLNRIDLGVIGLGLRSLEKHADRQATASAVVRALKTLTPRSRNPILAWLHTSLGGGTDNPPDEFRMMDWDDVRTMEATGLIAFGAHTANHEIVARLDDVELDVEIGQSVADIRANVRRPSRTFAYPNGGPNDFDPRSAGVLERLGARWALTTIAGLNSPGTDPFRIRRITVENHTTFARFRLASSGFIEFMRRPSRLTETSIPVGALDGQADRAVSRKAIGPGSESPQPSDRRSHG
ncbi:MAG TPA: polysaccharide deacetylase family protein [Longimicrobiales bacterium]|nr:polysaccharide deacetylase family protein [Longimicrobiales bacterium]